MFTCDLRLNTPRFANVQSIIKAKKKPIETLNLKDLGIDIEPRLKVEKVEMPPERKGGVMVSSVDELINKLRTEAKVIWLPTQTLLTLEKHSNSLSFINCILSI